MKHTMDYGEVHTYVFNSRNFSTRNIHHFAHLRTHYILFVSYVVFKEACEQKETQHYAHIGKHLQQVYPPLPRMEHTNSLTLTLPWLLLVLCTWTMYTSLMPSDCTARVGFTAARYFPWLIRISWIVGSSLRLAAIKMNRLFTVILKCE